ncbi:hypothetical protein ACQCN2_20870 [Brevibacillus ginsengisoli]|uniref:hypothetical protein n=1 Tax=Brevibacillus ginsengisoli TaxID=363854 RepID=UPI003CEF15FA
MMSDVCSVCGFPKPSHLDYCNNCNDKEMIEYRKVKEYLRTYPNSNAMQVANATGITVSKITRYLRDGLLTSVKDDRRSR